jgi:predicted HicB family RNase H-like nuclease
MTTLPPYRGFQAAVEYDDGVLLVRLLHIEDAVTTTCDAASEVTSAFRELVDDYIETCTELGEEPNRPFKGSFNVRIEPVLHRDAAMCAAAHDMTLNSWIGEAIREKLERDKAKSRYLLLETELRHTAHRPKSRQEEWGTLQPTEVADLSEYRTRVQHKRDAG